jgi:hypothetical protein
MSLSHRALVCVAALAACGDAPPPAAPPAPTPPPAAAPAPAPAGLTGAALVGTWVGPCNASPAGDGSFNQLTFRMTDTTWDLDYVAHGDATCSGNAKFLTVNIQGPYTIGGPSAAGPGAHEGTFGYTQKSVTAGQDAAVGFLKEKCGFDAKVGVPVDLAAGCANLGAYPIADCKEEFDIVRLEGDTLQFGKRPADSNMCAPDKRPTTFEGGAAVKKTG